MNLESSLVREAMDKVFVPSQFQDQPPQRGVIKRYKKDDERDGTF